MYTAHKIELRPDRDQENKLSQSCGVKRFVYNACLAKMQADYKEGIQYSRKAMQSYFQSLRKENPWLGDVSARCGYFAVDCLHDAMQRFFKKKARFPVFKRKGCRDSFKLEHSSFYSVDGRKLRLPKIGIVKMREKIRFQGRLLGVTIRPVAGKWFAIFLVEMTEAPKKKLLPREPIVGCDFGLKTAVMLSNGQEFSVKKPLKCALRRLRRLGRCLSRKRKGSNRHKRACLRLGRLHHKVQCQRSARLHHISDNLTRRFDHIVIEDLHVKCMQQNHRLARSLSDAAFGELRRQIEYKAAWRGCRLTIADRWFASTQICPQCGVKNEMPLPQRIHRCACGYTADRDLTAAVNLEQFGRHRCSGDLKRALEVSQETDDGAKDACPEMAGP